MLGVQEGEIETGQRHDLDDVRRRHGDEDPDRTTSAVAEFSLTGLSSLMIPLHDC